MLLEVTCTQMRHIISKLSLKGQGILFHQNLMNPDYDDEGMAVNASLKKQTCSYLFALWIDLLVSIMALVYSSTQVSQFLIAINIYNVISACFTLLMLVTIIYGLVVSCGKRQEKQGFFISLMQLSVAVLVLDLPLLFIFGDSTSLNLRIGAILASSIVLHIAKKY